MTTNNDRQHCPTNIMKGLKGLTCQMSWKLERKTRCRRTQTALVNIIHTQIHLKLNSDFLPDMENESLSLHLGYCHGRMARNGHELPKVSPGTAFLRPFYDLPAGRAACARLLPFWTLYAYAY